MNTRSLFLKVVLLLQAAILLVYTAFAFQREGSDLLAIFLANISALTWNGQFNLDFSCYLLLSGLWIAWRNRFSAASIGIAIAASIIGIICFAPYIFYLLMQESGDLKKVLIGSR